MKEIRIDINADVGEGLNNEAQLMPYLSSCNIACGGHAGDIITMTSVIRLAEKHKVQIGAHPSFPDKANFGRIDMHMSAPDLYSSLKHQISVLQNILYSENARLHHIKPHGALYNLAAKDEQTAKVVIEVLKSIALPVELYAPYDSVIAKLALKENINVIYEAFADRNYNQDLTLVSRKKKDAILGSKDEILNHVLRMIKNGIVRTLQGDEVPIKASTFCVHGDTKNAIQIVEYLNKELPKHDILIK
ncbi:5-oxoprolinase subunit PxpA [Winogradskyella sp.]|uniref:5-oxoprolinase subunit PxpA n=1 Tax=Winogradskyella sp. TaxID=1883156 RepID=UPI003F6B32B4